MEKFTLETKNVHFELLFNTHKTAYVTHLNTPQAKIFVNYEECVTFENFDQQIQMIFKRSDNTISGIKEIILDANQVIKLDKLRVKMNSNLYFWLMSFE